MSSSGPDPLEGLTDKQKAFLRAYVGSAAGNGAKAAREAGYAAASASVRASQLLAIPKMQSALVRLRRPLDMLAERSEEAKALVAHISVLEKEAAEATERVLMTADRAKVVDALMRIALGQSTEMRVTKTGEPYEAAPPAASQVSAAKVLATIEGWAAPVKVEHSGDPARPVTVQHKGVDMEAIARMTPEERKRRIAELEARKASSIAPAVTH